MNTRRTRISHLPDYRPQGAITRRRTLIKANAVAAVVFLLIGGLMGLLVALTRWPAVHLLPADWFYLALTGHGVNVLLFWIIFFEMAVLYFASAILLNVAAGGAKLGWVGFVLMVVGAIDGQCRGAAGQFLGDVHLVSADEGASR